MAEYGESLTDREKEVLNLVATGITNREVAQELFISVNTVKVHLRNVYTKLGADSRTEATMIGVREGWVTVEGEGGEDEEPSQDETIKESAGEEPEPAPEPAPPLSWPKRVALVVSLLLVVAVVAITWPRSEPQASNGPDLPLEQSEGDGTTARVADATETSWHELAQMPTRRAYLALAAMDDQILAIGGQTPDGVTAVMEAYNPEDDIWSPLSHKPTPAAHVMAAVIGSEVYVPGGCDAEGNPTRTVEVYNTETDTWREASSLPEPRCAYALTDWDEQLYLFGGWDGEQYVASGYVYDPEADAWAETTPMNTPQAFSGAAALNERIYVVGGYDGERELATCAAYDPAASSWHECAPLTVGRGGLGLVSLGGRLYAIGGGGLSSYLGFNERYNPTEDTWSTFDTPLAEEWRGTGVTVFDTTIYAIGGRSGDHLGLTLAYESLPFRIFIPVSQQ